MRWFAVIVLAAAVVFSGLWIGEKQQTQALREQNSALRDQLVQLRQENSALSVRLDKATEAEVQYWKAQDELWNGMMTDKVFILGKQPSSRDSLTRETARWNLDSTNQFLASVEYMKTHPSLNRYDVTGESALPSLWYIARSVQKGYVTKDEATTVALRFTLFYEKETPMVNCWMNNVWLEIKGLDSKTHGPACSS